jgi:hypothetical protein
VTPNPAVTRTNIAHAAALVAAALAATACESRIGLTIEKHNSAYVLSVSDCGSGKPFFVQAMAIYEGPRGICGVRQAVGGSGPEISKWEIGTKPPGFEAGACSPLVQGHTYNAHATADTRFVARRFKVASDGAVEYLEPTCKE